MVRCILHYISIHNITWIHLRNFIDWTVNNILFTVEHFLSQKKLMVLFLTKNLSDIVCFCIWNGVDSSFEHKHLAK